VGTATSSYHWDCIDSIVLESKFNFINTSATHSFSLVFIALLRNDSGEPALNGFLLATREQVLNDPDELKQTLSEVLAKLHW
jgi:hypothetical protein